MELDSLTLHEKIMQTMVVRIHPDTSLTEPVGGVFFFGEIITEASELGLDAARALLNHYIDSSRIPPLITSDFENGCGSMLRGLTPLPYLMSLGAADDEQLAYDYGRATALEARSVGANWTFSPVCDLNLNPRNPLVNVRCIGDEPTHASKLLRQVVRGMQEGGLGACAKHFPGDGVDWRDQHIVTTVNSLSADAWAENHGRVFQDLIDDGVLSIMAGHIALPAYQTQRGIHGLPLPATLSKELITDLLKKKMGFDGVVVTDALDMGGFGGWYPTRTEGELKAFAAGCDMMLWPSEEYPQALEEALRGGTIPMERLNDAVTRILRMKAKLGLMDRDCHAVALTEADRAFVAETQRLVAEHSITLLRDETRLFPFSPEKSGSIAVIPVTHYAPALEEALRLCDELRGRGFSVDYFPEDLPQGRADDYGLVLYALFSRPFRPIGFLDFMGNEAFKLMHSLQNGTDHTVVVSFGSPYFAGQYFERARCCVNAYSMLAPSVDAFVCAACGEIPFTAHSPVKL